MPVVVRKRPARVPRLLTQTLACASSGALLRGPAVAAFEAALGERLEGAPVVAVGSARLALLLLLDALGVQPPATILLAAYNASCVPNVLQAAGYRLHFVDIREDTLHLDPALLPSPPPSGSAAVIATHIEGSPAPVPEIRAWADRHGLLVVEDAAHALGARLGGRPVGTLADGAIFSLGRGKHLNTLGGGLAVTPRGPRARRLRDRAHRLPPPSRRRLLEEVVLEGALETGTRPALFGAFALPLLRLARRAGYDPMTALFEDDKAALGAIPAAMWRRLSNLQARFGLAALRDFDASLRARRAHAAALQGSLRGVVALQQPLPGAEPAWLELTALVEDRPRVQTALLARGVDTQRTWMDACDALPAFASATGGPCPRARAVAERALYLPTYAGLTPTQREAIAAAVLAACSAAA